MNMRWNPGVNRCRASRGIGGLWFAVTVCVSGILAGGTGASSRPSVDGRDRRENLMREHPGPVHLTEQGMAIHGRSLVIDGHNDLPGRIRDDFKGDVGP